MLAKMKRWFTPRNLSEAGPVFALLAVSLVVIFANYTPGTFLSGWDTLHPEFNFGLAFERTFFGVFRIEQGLGAVAGHSHMADLPRIILLYISHFIIPLSFLRYFYIFLTLFLGPIGMYFLLKRFFLKQKTASFLGSLFYLLNLGTLQAFNVPFEMFTTIFAALPFMFYFSFAYLEGGKERTKNLFLFGIVSLLNSPSSYAATLWYIFFLCFFTYFLIHILIDKKGKHSFKNFLILISVLLATNLFWIIPNIYFILSHGAEVARANINRLFSDQAFLKNREFGNIKDLLLLKSFYFDWSVYKGNGAFTDLLLPWITHLKDVKVLFIGYLFGFSFILGAIYYFKKFKLKSLPVFAVLLISLFFLINDNFPFSPVYKFLQNHIPFFKEALRFPDDKILNLFVFIISIFFGFFALFVIENIKKLKARMKNAEFIFAFITVILIFYYMLPAISGNFINSYMRIDIPKDYFNLFSYMKNEPDSIRVSNLPIQSPWGWVYYDWSGQSDNNETRPDARKLGNPSYQGAGFLYFGVKQPLLDRDFDRWSPYNESYYREMSYAIYSKNVKLLSNVINKYKIGIIFIDRNVIDPQNQRSILYFDEAKKLIRETGLIKDERIFGKIESFRLNVNDAKIASVNTNINVNPTTNTTYEDFAYLTYGSYITGENSSLSQVYYPFRDLIDNQSKLHKDLLKIDSEKITLIPSSKINNFNTSLLSQRINIIPSDLVAKKGENLIDLSIYPNTPIFDQTQSASSLRDLINTTGKKNVSLSVNRSEFFNLSGVPSNTPLAVGKILVNNNADNIISAFDTSSQTLVKGGLLSVNPFFSSCTGENSPTTGFTQNGVKITGKGDICIIIPYKFLSLYTNSSGSFLTELRFNLDSNASIDSCLLDLKSLNCLHYNELKRNGNQISLTSVLSSSQINNTGIKIFIKPQKVTENTFFLQNVNFFYSPSFSDTIFSKEDIAKIFINNKTLSFDKIYLSKNVIYDPGFEITNTKNLKNDCPSSQSSVKKEIVQENGKRAIRYYSALGSFCDHFSYPNLPHNQGYLIGVSSKNKQGLPMTLCVSNYKTDKCDIYSDLSSFSSFDRDVFLLAPINDNGVGYNINFENIGINKSPSENLVSSIEIIPIPYDFLLNVKSETKATNLFNGAVTDVKKINPLSYIVSTNSGNTILSFYYSYDKGFKAYQISCSNAFSCFLKANFAPFYAKEIKEHVLVDNWANGWIVENVKCQMSNRKCQIAIIFLPQYFEYLGLIIMALTFALIIYYHKAFK